MTEPIRKSIRVRCSAERAFEVFTGRIDQWWPRSHRFGTDAQVQLEAGLGGRFFAREASGAERELGRVIRWEPPVALAYTWLPGAGIGPTRVDVTFAADGDDTVVDVVHAEGEAQLGAEWSRRAKGFSAAWDEVLPAFASHITNAGDPS